MINDAIARWGVLAVFIFMVSNGFLSAPPSEVVISAAGALSIENNFLLFIFFLLIILANFLGTAILYLLSRYKGKVWYDKFKKSRFIRKYSFLNRIVPSSENLINFFCDRDWLVFVCRFCPFIRSLISVPAGISNMAIWKYSIYSLLGISIWTGFWLYIGRQMMTSYLQNNYVVLLICFLIFIIVGVLSRLIRKRVKR